MKALLAPERDIRFHAACALVRIDPRNEAAVGVVVGELPALIKMLQAGDGQRVIHAARVLGCLGPRAEPAVPALRAVMNSPRQWALPSMAAAAALLKIRPGQVPDPFPFW
jgi:hypothetical protein